MAYLDDTGLAYFWGKIKAWANSVFALLGHTHPSSDVTLMTGYSKPASGSAVAASDTLNQAVGKVEAKVDEIGGDYVSASSDGVVSGLKEFSNSYTDSTSPEYSTAKSSSILIRIQDYEKGTATSIHRFGNIIVLDEDGDNIDYHGRLGAFETTVRPDGTSATYMSVYKNLPLADLQSPYQYNIGVGIDADGLAFGNAPSTSLDRISGNDIVTRDWIPKDTRIVHTSGEETISGIKYFNNTIRAGTTLQYRNSTLTRGVAPSENKYYTLAFYDKDGYNISNRFGLLETVVSSDGGVGIAIGAYRNIANTNTVASIGVVAHADGSSHAYAPSTDINRTNGNDIVTRDFIPQDTRIVHTTGNETINGEKTFINSLRMNVNYGCVYRTVTGYSASQMPGTVEWIGGYTWRDKDLRSIMNIEPHIGSTYLECQWYCTGCDSSGSNMAGVVVGMKHAGGEETFRPRFHNQMMLGNGNQRWKQLFAVTATINTSDERLKSGIAPLPETVLDAWEDVDWIQFQFRDAVAEKGAGARLHAGLIAQRVAEAFSRHGLDESRYAFFCHDVWDAAPESRSPDGTVMPASEAGDMYSVRYEEALCMEAAYMRRENARLKARVASLEDRLAALELRLGSE